MQKPCAVCRKDFEYSRATAKYCGENCKKAAQRGAIPPAPIPAIEAAKESDEPEGLLTAVRKELEAAGRLNSRIGQQAILLATQMTGKYHTIAGMSTLSKELDRIMDAALRTSVAVVDPVDELKAKRDAKRNIAG